MILLKNLGFQDSFLVTIIIYFMKQNLTGMENIMKTIIELMTDEFKKAFAECGYSEEYARITISNRPDLCEFQCNGAMAAAKTYKKLHLLLQMR